MKFLLTIYPDAEAMQANATAMAAQIMAGHMKLMAELTAARVKWSNARLQPPATAKTVRTEGSDQTLHDGPFAETREFLGGYYLIDVKDFDAAVKWARKIPLPGRGSVEVRQVM